ncbi:1183_t:CDS:2, partial [Entrophospora sp. SA101]
ERFTVIYDCSDVNTGENKIEKAVKGVKGDIDYKKEVIQKIQKFLAKNISAELHQELNLAFQKCCELEKILPELEKLAGECERESQACRGKFVREKGGHGDVEYTEEEVEKHHKEIREHLEKKLKEERNNLSPSQIERLEQRPKLYNE